MTDIFLYQGEPNPNDIRLRDPTAPGSILNAVAMAGLLAASYNAWVPDPPSIQTQSKVIVSVDNPPRRQALDYSEVYGAWQALDSPSIQGPTPKLIISVDNPPRRQALDYSEVYGAWLGVDPPSIQGPPAKQRISVDNPPRRQIDYSPAYTAWQAPDQFTQQRGPFYVAPPIVAPSFQPYSVISLLAASYTAWVQPDSLQQSARNLPPSFLAVRVDNPPIVQLANLPAASYATWTISLESPYVQYPYTVGAITGGVIPPSSPFDYITFARRKGRR